MEREELAWAAGLFDGEGCFHFLLQRRKDTSLQPLTQTRMTQVDREVLDRFQAAVGLGTVYGPYPKNSPWQYAAYGFEKTQAIVAKLWSWLGSQKRAQAVAVLQAAKPHIRQRPPGRPRKNPTPPNPR